MIRVRLRGALGTGAPVAVSASAYQCDAWGASLFRVLLRAGQARAVTGEQLELISADPRVMHGQAVIAGTRVPVSVILDCLAAGMTAEQITAEYPTVTVAGVRAAAAYGAALAREELLPIPPSR